jgi:transposase
MHNKAPRYAQAFRDQMVELVRSGRKPSELSKEFGCHTTSVLGWVRQARGSSPARLSADAAALNARERKELVELRQVQIKRDILAKAGPSSPARARRRPLRLQTRKSESGRTTSTHHV